MAHRYPPLREWQWPRAVWRGRGEVRADRWRLYFAVLVYGEAVGMRDLTGKDFARFGTVSTFSWLAPGSRGPGPGQGDARGDPAPRLRRAGRARSRRRRVLGLA